MKYINGLIFIAAIFLFACNSNTFTTGEYKLIDVPSPSLKDALIDAKETHKVGIYLPPSYNNSSKDYPVVYFLTGFTCHPGEYPPTKWIDSVMVNNVVREMIYVEISGYNLFQGTMYANSSVTGNWEDFVTKDVIHYIDNHYRTIPTREARGIAGHSMGGGGCFNISLKHADKYAVAYPMSPALSMNDSLVDIMFSVDTLLPFLNNLEKLMSEVNDMEFQDALIHNFDTSNIDLLWLLGYGSAFTENLEKPLRFSLPFYIDQKGNKLRNEESYSQWQNGFSNIEFKVQKYKDNLLSYRHYAMDCGYQDEINWLKVGTKHTIDIFQKYNIPLSVHWYNGDHVNRIEDQMSNRVMPIMSNYLQNEAK